MVVMVATALSGCSWAPGEQELLERARAAMIRGDDRVAVIDLKRLLQRNPENGEARRRLGELLLRAGDPQGALFELERAEQLGEPLESLELPLIEAQLAVGAYQALLQRTSLASVGSDSAKKKEVLRVRGDALLATGRIDEAARSFAEALAIDPGHVGAILGTARLALRNRDFALALERTAEASRLAPSDPTVSLVRGAIMAEQGRWAEATAALDQARRDAAAQGRRLQQVVALLGLADVQLRSGEVEAALQSAARLMELTGGAPTAQLVQARALIQAGRLDEARPILERMVAAEARNPAAALLLGVVAHAQQRFGQADMYLSTVVALDPDNEFARRLLADARLQQSKPQQALDSLMPLIQRSDADGDALAAAGRASLMAGDLESGIHFFERRAVRRPGEAGPRLDLAAALIIAGRLPAASALLAQPVEAGPDRSRRDRLDVLLRVRSGRESEAYAAARALAAADAEDADMQLLAAHLALLTRQVAAAKEHVQAALRLRPEAAEAHLLAGRIAFAAGRSEDATRSFERAAALPGGEARGRIALSALALSSARPSRAVELLQQAAAVDSTDGTAPSLLAQFFLGQGDVSRALSNAEAAYARAPSDPRVLATYAAALIGSGNAERGFRALRDAVGRAPQSVVLRASLARAYAAAGRFEEATDEIQAARRIDPTDSSLLASQAAIALRQGRTAEASELLAELRRRGSRDETTQILEGDLALAQRRYADAARAYAAAARSRPSAALAMRESQALRFAGSTDYRGPLLRWLERDPSAVAVRLALAEDMVNVRAFTDAIAQYERVLALVPEHPIALNNLAFLYTESGDARAVALAERAYDKMRRSPQAADTLGWALLRAGQRERAVALLADAARALPRAPAVQYHYAVALMQTGREREARDILQRLIDSGATFDELPAAARILEESRQAAR
jgi:putative PEP-CTERM system TPR-repeat lipoprotein